MPSLSNHNKPRLYMALHATGEEKKEIAGVNYHTSLLYLPKKPNKKRGYMYHMNNGPGLDSDIWRYRCNYVRNRTLGLLAVALLGKVKKEIHESDLDKMLSVIPHKDGEYYHHWAWEAIDVLADAGVIEPTDGQALWNSLVAFTDNFPDFAANKLVPTLDRHGNQIESEIGPLYK